MTIEEVEKFAKQYNEIETIADNIIGYLRNKYPEFVGSNEAIYDRFDTWNDCIEIFYFYYSSNYIRHEKSIIVDLVAFSDDGFIKWCDNFVKNIK